LPAIKNDQWRGNSLPLKQYGKYFDTMDYPASMYIFAERQLWVANITVGKNKIKKCQ